MVNRQGAMADKSRPRPSQGGVRKAGGLNAAEKDFCRQRYNHRLHEGYGVLQRELYSPEEERLEIIMATIARVRTRIPKTMYPVRNMFLILGSGKLLCRQKNQPQR